MSYELTEDGVKKDGRRNIPNDPANRDWQEYKVWLGKGNTPDPAVLPPTIPARSLDTEELFDMLKTKGLVADADRPRQRS